MLMSIQRDFSIHRDFFIPHLNPWNQWWLRLRISPSLVPLGGEQYHSFMKHGFFCLKQFLSHITKFPRCFWSSGIFPFTGIYLAGFFHSPRYFLSSRGFFHSLWFESLIFIQNSKIFKEMVRRFFTFSEKTIKYLC